MNPFSNTQAEKIEHLLERMNHKLDLVLRGEILGLKMELNMTKEIDDLNAAFGNMQTAVNGAVTDIQSLKDELAAANQNGDSAAIEEVVGKMNTLADTLSAAAAVPSAVNPTDSSTGTPVDNTNTPTAA